MRSCAVVGTLLCACCLGGAVGQPSSATQSGPPRAVDTRGLEAFPPGANREVVIRACAPCHAPELVVAKRRSAAEWDRIILTMVERGAVASDEEQLQILEYLLHFFGPTSDGAGD
jgi:hypothetical protein